MEGTTSNAIIIYSFSIVILSLAFKVLCLSKPRSKNLPPSPPPLPIIGHLLFLKPPLHRAFFQLSQKLGPVFSLQLGSRLAVVVSSTTAVEECFTKYDIVLSNRPKFLENRSLAYKRSTIMDSPYGEHWNNLRRISSIEIFSSIRLNVFYDVRKAEVRRLLLKLSRNSREAFAKVELRRMFEDMTFNNIMIMMTGKRYYGEDVTDDSEAKEFKDLLAEVLEISGVEHPGDYLPILNRVYNNFEKKMMVLANRMDGFMQGLIDERRNGKPGNTMIDHLLSLQQEQPEYYTDMIIKGLMFIILIAGTDVTAVTLEWAMSNLLNHPDVLKKAKAEIDAQIGQERLIDEADIANLPYLQNIMYETLRLYPSAPILVPRTPSEDCTIAGYTVPRDTMVVINAWAIHRDPQLWDDPTSFKPERFDNIKVKDGYKFIPFGTGRRSCPGSGMAHRMVNLSLGSLIQCFEWERVGEEMVDMTEGKGITMPKVEPLVAMCKARPILNKVLR